MNNNPISIAIDGPSGAGKSTLARRCAEAFGFLYVDTGAIYRTVGLAALRRGIDRKDMEAVSRMLPDIQIEMKYNEAGEQRMFLDSEDVSEAIRLPEISICASDVSSLALVRRYLMDMQRSLARENNVIMDGRDIGTVVLPNADLKIFLTASAEKVLLAFSSPSVVINTMVFSGLTSSGMAFCLLIMSEMVSPTASHSAVQPCG